MKFLAVLLFAFLATCAQANIHCPTIVGRDRWTNVPPRGLNYLILPLPYVVIHHSVTPECNTKAQCAARTESIRSYHMDSNGWDDIGYSFLVGGDGNVYEGCGWSREGAHTYGYNKKSIGIGFIGNFENKKASQQMLNAAHQLVRCGVAQGILRHDVRVIGARQVRATLSPGAKLYEQIQDWPEWSAATV